MALLLALANALVCAWVGLGRLGDASGQPPRRNSENRSLAPATDAFSDKQGQLAVSWSGSIGI
eukprot:11755712-Alexandrium_andersonii.AAC.1